VHGAHHRCRYNSDVLTVANNMITAIDTIKSQAARALSDGIKAKGDAVADAAEGVTFAAEETKRFIKDLHARRQITGAWFEAAMRAGQHDEAVRMMALDPNTKTGEAETSLTEYVFIYADRGRSYVRVSAIRHMRACACRTLTGT
jgi:hypothetical protein